MVRHEPSPPSHGWFSRSPLPKSSPKKTTKTPTPIARMTPSSPLAPQSHGSRPTPQRYMGGSMRSRYERMVARSPRSTTVGSSWSRRSASGTHGAAMSGKSHATTQGSTISKMRESASVGETSDSQASGSMSHSVIAQRVVFAFRPTERAWESRAI
eukprot:scaffold95315_cov37-Tisochrysis_lutea.AAC.3